MPEQKNIAVIVLGTGHVGGAFLNQLFQTRDALMHRYGLRLIPVGLADSSAGIIDPQGFSAEKTAGMLAAKQQGQKLARQPSALAGITPWELVEQAAALGIAPAILVDTTAADGMEPALHRALELGGGVVLANKRPLAGPWGGAQALFDSPRARFEATVGAGLPVIYTLRYLVDTGDDVVRIEGALSGTLGYLCSRLEEGESFSASVSKAKALGYTEPDPRDDLSGMDVARKALILARLAGWRLELADIRVEALYPAEMSALSVEAFMDEMPRLDAGVAAFVSEQTGAPRYLAEVTPQGGTVGLRMVGEQVAAQLRGTLNRISFTTRRYEEKPMVVLGPGAGIEVTAAAVLGDCIQVALSTLK